jgi:bifunctional non-homologous end joining protein LigD
MRTTPMLAVLADAPFDQEGWLFEWKWDGYRALGYKKKNGAHLFSRNMQSFDARFPEILKELKRLPGSFILDGEIVIFNKKKAPDFQLLQQHHKSRTGTPYYYLFDILSFEGKDLTALPLIERKKILEKLLKGGGHPHLRLSRHVEGKGTLLFKQAKKLGFEGIIAKRAKSPYRFSRSSEWLKIKTKMRQEFVIGGFTEPSGGRKFFGALLVGVYAKGKLRYAGHVGGGFDQRLLTEVNARLKKCVAKRCPFEKTPKTNTPATWIKPKLVCEVAFAEWTQEGILRQPIFKGLRFDKPPKEVVREYAILRPPKKGENAKEAAQIFVSGTRDVLRDTARSEDQKCAAKVTPAVSHFLGESGMRFTNLDKIFWKKKNLTKGDLISYYARVAPYILPYLKNRPLALKRFPDGVDANPFFQKESGPNLPSFIKTASIEHSNKTIRYFILQNPNSLLYVANLAAIELHPMNGRLPHIDRPDYLVLDLDPPEGEFQAAVAAARGLHELLEDCRIPSFCKTSGMKGLHIYIPLNGKYNYREVKDFAYLLARCANLEMPDLTTLERIPARRRGKVYIDIFQNQKLASLICPYSARGSKEATVSTPLLWSEVNDRLDPAAFTIETVPKRLSRKGDVFSAVLGKGIDLERVLANFALLVGKAHRP